jgi:hypothetical protein
LPEVERLEVEVGDAVSGRGGEGFKTGEEERDLLLLRLLLFEALPLLLEMTRSSFLLSFSVAVNAQALGFGRSLDLP